MTSWRLWLARLLSDAQVEPEPPPALPAPPAPPGPEMRDELRLRSWLREQLGDSGMVRVNSAGHLVVGVARTVHRTLHNGSPGQGVDADLVTVMFERDLARHRAELAREFPWVAQLVAPRLAVLVALCIELAGGWRAIPGAVLRWMEQAAELESGEQREAYLRAAQQLVAAPLPARSLPFIEVLAKQLTTGDWET